MTCNREAAAVAALTSEVDVAIVGIPGRDVRLAYELFVERHHLSHIPQIEDVDGSLWSYFGVSGQPAWIFFDHEGGVNRGRGPIPDKLFKSGT